MENQRLIHLSTMPYPEYLKTPEWAEKRESVLDRDDYRCRLCNSDEKLQIHHRTYIRRGNEDLNDLTTLCEACHEHFHKKQSHDDIMGRTYVAPSTKEPNKLVWEDRLMGLLIQHTSLLPYVRGIINESDFLGADTRQLYQILNASPDEQPVVLPEFAETVTRTTAESVKSFARGNDSELAKWAIQCATRIKRASLLQRNTEMTYQIDAAVHAGDNEEVQRLSKQLSAIQREMRAIYSASHLQ